ncbi:MAG: peroxidase-related enzyme [Bradyrhizobium sp.]
MPHLPSLPAHASLLDVFRMFPETNEPLISFHEILLRGPSPFTEAERELIAAYVSGLNGCRYCHGVHTATAERLGIAPGAISALLDGNTSAIPYKMMPVLDFAKKLTQRANGVTKVDADAVLAAGWEETAVYHLVAVVALFNYMNRLVEGLGIELNPSYAQTAAKRLADFGYLPLIELMKKPVETIKRTD